MYLDKDTFANIIASTPLVSIDLVLTTEDDKALVGERLNRPAQGCWFVPGGRIYKNEPLAEAFKRLTTTELGIELNIEQAQLLGAYDHFYADNVFNEQGSTHYVALGYKIVVNPELFLNLPFGEQHQGYQWLAITELLAHPQVHTNTKAYFR
jgi:colanic acid biosynthesis protein WcaH